ncbi:membrane-bound lytic murein transglycosylase D [Noviherbaspirillum humi]|uniref:Membrane-bound lytic murein transglycosylase D n=1 Tax=Noviherbaspirillum humi TaxID=1688639 RepID=A0A239DF60_9BURK|nr:transglycosylase SLT domain-containing protein [Noviherbaspirillum humi]SNS30501.1 membrane-bound lytic murein transglycosylase D [Noviherbaspirillum humi]
MHTLKSRRFPFAALLLLAAPIASTQAADLSLPIQNWSQSLVTDLPYDPNDPVAQLLSMEEVDVWGRIRRGFAIPDLDNPLVANHIQWYTSRPDYIQRTTTRASRYLFHVVQELEKRGMPTELALLPFIESAFNPQALSPAQAAGMWQFIPSTGRDFNLKQSTFKDDRRDVLASTDAALAYLQKLYNMFGDWQLALAAYNWGEGSVQRAVNKNKAAGLPTDFNSLSALMPAETRNYVPKLQAVKNLIAAPAQYGIALPKVDNQPYFVTIGKTRDIDIKVAAQLAELSVDEFKALNPQFNRPVITGSSNTQILLPQSNAEKFKANLSKWGRALSSWTAHTVTSARERIETIASKFGTTPEVIREVNNIPPRMRVKAGSTVLVPKTDQLAEADIAPEVADNARLAIEPDVPDTRKIFVKVGKHDSLDSIASRYKVSVEQIRGWNNLHQNKLSKGQSLQLQVPFNQGGATRTASAKHVEPARPATVVATASSKRAAAPARHVARPAPARKVAAPAKQTQVAKKTAAPAKQPAKKRQG